MKRTKISITIDSDLLEKVKAYANGNLSRYINEVLRDKVNNEGLRKLVAEYEEEYGAFTAEELAEAEAHFRAAEEGWAAWQGDSSSTAER